MSSNHPHVNGPPTLISPSHKGTWARVSWIENPHSIGLDFVKVESPINQGVYLQFIPKKDMCDLLEVSRMGVVVSCKWHGEASKHISLWRCGALSFHQTPIQLHRDSLFPHELDLHSHWWMRLPPPPSCLWAINIASASLSNQLGLEQRVHANVIYYATVILLEIKNIFGG